MTNILAQLIQTAASNLFTQLTNLFGWSGAVALISLLIAILVQIIVFLLSPRLQLYNSSKIFKLHSHLWVEGDIFLSAGQGPAFCNSCSGMVLHGLTCVICGRCCHKEHVKATSLQPCKHRAKKDLTEIQAEGDYKAHQWVEGNLPLHASCYVCLE